MNGIDHDLKKELHTRLATDAALFTFVQKESSGGILYWNPENPGHGWQSARFWVLLGYTVDEDLDQATRWTALFDSIGLQTFQQQVDRHGRDPAHPYERLLTCPHEDGSTIWLRCRALVIDHDGKPSKKRILCTLTDVTAQKLAERRLKKSPEFLSAVFNSIQDGISVLDRDYNIVTVNRAMEQWYAHKLPLEGKKCHAVYHGRYETCETCPAARAMQSGKLEMSEIPLIRRSETIGTLELFAFPMLNKDGQTEAVVEYVRDITARKHSESLLKEREQLFRSLFEENKCVMLLVDPQTGSIVDANLAACSFYGYSKTGLKKKKITALNTLSQTKIFENMESARSEQKNFFEFRHRLADGTLRDVEVFSGPITIRGTPLLCSVIHDVTSRKEVEKEKENLIEKLQKALSEVKTLRGFLPICASCKKIRDDKGYWNQIETYIRNHSEAEFSHGLCPECVRKLYPGLNIKTKQ